MKNVLLSDDHYSMTVESDMYAICEPIFKEFGVNYFGYAKIFDNNKLYALATNCKWHQHRLEQGYKVTPPIATDLLQRKRIYYYVTPNDPFSPVLYDLRSLFNLDNVFFIIDRSHDYIESFCFCSDAKNEGIVNFYMNHIDLIDKFILYFKEKSAQLTKKSESNKIIIPEHMQTQFKGIGNANGGLQMPEYRKSMVVRKYDLGEKFNNAKITDRELDTLRYFSASSSIKETAKVMNLSPRTVETYVNNIKNKLNCSRKHELLRIIRECDLL